MRFTITLIFTILCMSLQAQMDTVQIYPGFDMTYLQRGDTIMVSEWKFAKLFDVIRMMHQETQYWEKESMYARRAKDACDSMAVEMERMAGVWKERSIMYRDMYQHTIDDAHKLHGMVIDCVEIAKDERKKGRINGIVIGGGIGFVVGAVVAAIILK